jgi:hypothetical protein
MGKTRSNKKKTVMKSINKSIKTLSTTVLPAVDKGLKTVGTTTVSLVNKSAPIVEKGVSNIYSTMSTGFDLGVKGVKNVAKGVKNISKKTHRKKGGRRRKTKRY